MSGPATGTGLRRRSLLSGLGALGTTAALGAAGARLLGPDGAEAATVPDLAPPSADQPGPGDLRGPFDWRRAAGQSVSLLLSRHTYSRALLAELDTFRRRTGITVRVRLFDEADYFDAVTAALLDPAATYDVFMTGACMIWQYGPPGWMEDLGPWLADPAVTDPAYEPEDFTPSLLDANCWDLTVGSSVGTGGQWALPWGCETTVLTYQADLFRRLRLTPPTTFAELHEVAAAYQAGARRLGVADAYGLAVRGADSWASMQAGFITQFHREGARDYAVTRGRLVPQLASRASTRFHEAWVWLLQDAGPRDWASYSYADCAGDLGRRQAGMMYDGSAISYPLNQPGRTAAAGRLAWAPGPAGPTGSLDSNLWVWSLAMNSRSRRKLAAWLLLQWATGREHLLQAALQHAHVDPVRESVAQARPLARLLGANPGYVDTLRELRSRSHLLFTPQPHFFQATARWASTVQSIYRNGDATGRLRELTHDLTVSQ